MLTGLASGEVTMVTNLQPKNCADCHDKIATTVRLYETPNQPYQRTDHSIKIIIEATNNIIEYDTLIAAADDFFA